MLFLVEGDARLMRRLADLKASGGPTKRGESGLRRGALCGPHRAWGDVDSSCRIPMPSLPNGIGHGGASRAHWFFGADRRVASCLMLHLGVELSPEQDDDGREP